MREHGLAGPRLACDRREALARPQLGPLDQEQVLYAQLEQHRQVYQRDPTEREIASLIQGRRNCR